MTDSKGWVKVSAKTLWDTEQPDQEPTLELKIELTQYTSRSQMANMLRQLAHWLDEGVLHKFDMPTEDATYHGEWDDEEKVFRVYRDDEEIDQR
jgi:hypothetical protein